MSEEKSTTEITTTASAQLGAIPGEWVDAEAVRAALVLADDGHDLA